ncbi:MAG TPA: DNA-binding protein WhiA [Lachnospiraceae bacterium]|jgi:DNA-binding protein WhiA|nr:DNA-binding protein WhiA [Lachnospiraceae bacterium]
MSFTEEVRAELGKTMAPSTVEQESELGALLCCTARFENDGLLVTSDSPAVRTKCFTLLEKASKISNMRDFGLPEGEDGVFVRLPGRDLLRLRGWFRKDGTLVPSLVGSGKQEKAYVRGMVLGTGTFADPAKEYFTELTFRSIPQRSQMEEILSRYSVDLREGTHHRLPSLYARDAQAIADLLALCGAGESVLALENARVLRQFRGNINRQVNCETANIAKTVSASRKQIEDIDYLADHGVLETLPEPLQEMARVRRDHPDASLPELGSLLDPPVGKSGVNHRLRRLSEAADRARNQGRNEETTVDAGNMEEQ